MKNCDLKRQITLIILFSSIFILHGFAKEKYGANFYPPVGKVLHMAGQDRESFADYIKFITKNGDACESPAGVAFYSSLYLTGFKTPRANRPGDNHQDLPSVLSYEPLVPQIMIWLDRNELKLINSGKHKKNIQKFAQILRSYKRPIYLKIGGEFEDGRFPDPKEYIKAYRHIVKAFHKNKVRNVSYVWQSLALKPTYQNRDILDWYPGDAYVNWIGISFFQIGKEGYFEDHNRDRVLEVSKEKKIPIMIVEASAIRYTASQKKVKGEAYWQYWYKPFFDYIENNPEVKGFSIINCDWDSQAQFKRFSWGDCQIKSDPYVLKKWLEKMKEEQYLHSNEKLYTQLGFKE